MAKLMAEKRDTTGFGARMKELREARGWSQATLGAQCKPRVAYQQVARLERAEQTPSWPMVLRLAKALGVGPEAFMPDESHEQPETD